jgi:hypothetical protein
MYKYPSLHVELQAPTATPDTIGYKYLLFVFVGSHYMQEFSLFFSKQSTHVI